VGLARHGAADPLACQSTARVAAFSEGGFHDLVSGQEHDAFEGADPVDVVRGWVRGPSRPRTLSVVAGTRP
jgi:hypothetical protein